MADYGRIFNESFDRGWGLVDKWDEAKRKKGLRQELENLPKGVMGKVPTRVKTDTHVYAPDASELKMLQHDVETFGDDGARAFESRYGLQSGVIGTAPKATTFPLSGAPGSRSMNISTTLGGQPFAYEPGSGVDEDFHLDKRAVVPTGLQITARGPRDSPFTEAELAPLRADISTRGRAAADDFAKTHGVSAEGLYRDVPMSERFKQMEAAYRKHGFDDKAEAFGLKAMEAVVKEREMGRQDTLDERSRIKFEQEQNNYGNVLHEQAMRLQQLQQQIDQGKGVLSDAEVARSVKEELAKLAKANHSFESLIDLADRGKNDGIAVKMSKTANGVTLTYGGVPMFEGMVFKTPQELSKVIEQGIIGNPKVYAEWIHEQQQREAAAEKARLENAETQAKTGLYAAQARAAGVTANAAMVAANNKGSDTTKPALPQISAERRQAMNSFNEAIQAAGNDPKLIQAAKDRYRAALDEIDEYYGRSGEGAAGSAPAIKAGDTVQSGGKTLTFNGGDPNNPASYTEVAAKPEPAARPAQKPVVIRQDAQALERKIAAVKRQISMVSDPDLKRKKQVELKLLEASASNRKGLE
jgi:hypothetical protein